MNEAPFDRFGIDPIGTAGHYSAFVLVEWRLPWTSDIFDDEALAAVNAAVERAAERGEPTRVLGLVPGTGIGAPSGLARLIRYRHDGSTYVRTEALVPVDDLPGEIERTVDGADPQPAVPDGDERRDLLICTHGRRDRRCGKQGLKLFGQVAARWPDQVRVWRVSHLGGHRFAPTSISFPEGWYWGNTDVDLLDAVVRREGEPAELAHHLRGNAALPRPAQLVDRDGFLEKGWAWATRRREAVCEELGERRTAVTLTGNNWERTAVVGVGREVPTTSCDSACDDPSLVTPELAVLER